MLNLKKMLNGNSIRIGKDYKNLNGGEIRTLLYLQCLSNANNYVVLTNTHVLRGLIDMHVKTIKKHLISLESKNRIKIYGDINNYCSIEIIEDETFEIYENIEFVLDMLNGLNDAELKLYCIMSSHLNFKENKNYIYPALETLVKEYYTDEELNDNLENEIRYINRIKNKLIEKGFIKKIAAFYFYKENKENLGKSTLGYFLNTGKHDVQNNEYMQFIYSQIATYNNTHTNKMDLADIKYLKKCKYNYLDKYIYKDKIEDSVETSEVVEEIIEVKTSESNKDIFALFKDIMNETPNKALFDRAYNKIKSINKKYTDDIIYQTIYDDRNSLYSICDNCGTNAHKINSIFKFVKDNIDENIKMNENVRECECYTKDYSDSELDWFDYDKIDIPKSKVHTESRKRRSLNDILNGIVENKVESMVIIPDVVGTIFEEN